MNLTFKDVFAVVAVVAFALTMLLFFEERLVLRMFGNRFGIPLLGFGFALMIIGPCVGWYAGLTFESFGFGLVWNIVIGIIGAVVFGPFLALDFQWVVALPVMAIAGTIGASIAGRLMQALGRSDGLHGVGAFIVVGIIGFIIGAILFTWVLGEVLFGDPRFHYGVRVLSAVLGGGWFILLVGGLAQLVKRVGLWPRSRQA